MKILGIIEETGDSFMSSLINIEEDTSLDTYPASSKICSNINNKMYIIDDKIYIPHIDSYFYNLDYTAEGKYLKFSNGSILTNEQINCFLKRTAVTDSKGKSWNNDVIYNIPLLDISDFPGYEFYKNQLGIYLILHFPSSISQNEITYGLPLYLDNIDNITIAPELNEEYSYDITPHIKILTSNGYINKDIVLKIPVGATKLIISDKACGPINITINNNEKCIILSTDYNEIADLANGPVREPGAVTIYGLINKLANNEFSSNSLDIWDFFNDIFFKFE